MFFWTDPRYINSSLYRRLSHIRHWHAPNIGSVSTSISSSCRPSVVAFLFEILYNHHTNPNITAYPHGASFDSHLRQPPRSDCHTGYLLPEYWADHPPQYGRHLLDKQDHICSLLKPIPPFAVFQPIPPSAVIQPPAVFQPRPSSAVYQRSSSAKRQRNTVVRRYKDCSVIRQQNTLPSFIVQLSTMPSVSFVQQQCRPSKPLLVKTNHVR